MRAAVDMSAGGAPGLNCREIARETREQDVRAAQHTCVRLAVLPE